MGISHLCVIISLLAGNLYTELIFTERFQWIPKEVNGTGKYSEESNTPILGMQFYKDKILLARIVDKPDSQNKTKNQVLGQVDLSTTKKAPPITPYAADGLANQLQSPSPLEIDVCERLWLVDFEQMRLFVINLKDEKKIRDVKLNISASKTFSGIGVDVFVNPESGIPECDNTYAYIPHPGRFEIAVYRFSDNAQWVVNQPTFSFQNMEGTPLSGLAFQQAISNYTYRYGLMGAALSEANEKGSNDRTLYGIASDVPVIFAISTKILKNPPTKPQYTVLGWSGFLSPAFYYHKPTGIIFYDRAGDNLIGCWNTKKFPNVVSFDTTDGIKAPGVTLKMIYTLMGDTQDNLWLNELHWEGEVANSSDRAYSTRLFSVPILDLVKNTKCQP